jgi:hypothetical protein
LIPTRREWRVFEVASKLRPTHSGSIEMRRIPTTWVAPPVSPSTDADAAAAKSILRRRGNHRYGRHNSILRNRKEEHRPFPISNYEGYVKEYVQ